jgi:hypothetical protein
MKAYLKDLSDVIDHESGLTCGGGYGFGDCVYIDERLSRDKQRLTLVHEVLEIHFPRVKHSRIDRCAIDLIDCLRQLNFLD